MLGITLSLLSQQNASEWFDSTNLTKLRCTIVNTQKTTDYRLKENVSQSPTTPRRTLHLNSTLNGYEENEGNPIRILRATGVELRRS